MKIVIDIDEKTYTRIKTALIINAGNTFYNEILTSVAEGTPLPKGHGDLIDRNALIQKQFIPNVGWELVDLDDLKTAPAVIPADK